VREHQTGVLLEIGADLGAIDSALVLVGEEDLNDIGTPDCFRHGIHFKTVFGCSLPAVAGPQADDDLAARITQVQRLPAALGAIADDGDGPALQNAGIRIGLVKFLHHMFSHPIGPQTR